MLEYKRITVGYLQVNCYLVKCTETGKGVVIDPGADIDKILLAIDKFVMEPVAVVLTHSHFDHATYAVDLRNKYSIPLLYHARELETALDPQKNLTGMYSLESLPIKADRLVEDGDIIAFGNQALKVLFTPGHTPGSMCCYAPGVLFSGDTLFRQNVGRCDFPGGDQAALARSIQQKLFVLPGETAVNPGHNNPTEIGFERENNYLAQELISQYCGQE